MQNKFSDIYRINEANIKIIKTKPHYDKDVVKWIESIMNDTDPIEINLIISDMVFGHQAQKLLMSNNLSINIELPCEKKKEIKKAQSFNLEPYSECNKREIAGSINSKGNTWKIFSFKYENGLDFKKFFENGFDFDFEVIENETHTFSILEQKCKNNNGGCDSICQFYNKNALNIAFIKNFEKYTKSLEKFYYKLMKLNFLVYHLIKKFNSQFEENRIWFAKCLIFRKADEIFYAEKPLKKENKFDAHFINVFSQWLFDISNGKMIVEIKKSNILSNFVLHSYNRYFEEFDDEGLSKITEFKQKKSLSCYLGNPLNISNPSFIKINKKCASVFCNSFSFDEYCKDCQKLILKKDCFKCEKCRKEFIDQPNLYLFKGKSLPKYCKSCSI